MSVSLKGEAGVDCGLTHIFAVKLKKETSHEDAREFLQKTAEMLPAICGVQNFRMYEKTKGENEYIFYMEFEDAKAYELYNAHPIHFRYVMEVWDKVAGTVEVIDLKEINAEKLLSEGGYDGQNLGY